MVRVYIALGSREVCDVYKVLRDLAHAVREACIYVLIGPRIVASLNIESFHTIDS